MFLEQEYQRAFKQTKSAIVIYAWGRITSVVIIIPWRYLPQTQMTITDFVYLKALWYSCSRNILVIWLSNRQTLSVPDEGYPRSLPCTLNWISTFLFQMSWFYHMLLQYHLNTKRRTTLIPNLFIFFIIILNMCQKYSL